MGTWFISGDSHEIAWFTETERASEIDCIKAVVVRRRSRSGASRTPLWRTLLRALSPRRTARAVRDHAMRQSSAGWSGSVGSAGPDQVLYSRERAVVSAGGREFSVPHDARALIVLIDARAPSGRLTFETREVTAPTVPRPRSDPSEDNEGNRQRMRARFVAERDVWHRWLDEEPTIRAFLGRRTDDGTA